MLSFDITDRHIRIIRGTESRGRIRVSSASTIDLSEGLIVNGHIKDIPKMATIINDELKARRMDDKEAVVTLSSNLVIFKELHIPKAKTAPYNGNKPDAAHNGYSRGIFNLLLHCR